MSEIITQRDEITTWADVKPTIHRLDPLQELARELWKIRDYLGDLAEDLERMSDVREQCECKPLSEIKCYSCRKIEEAKEAVKRFRNERH